MAKIIDKTPDRERAKSMRRMARRILKRIDETDREEYPTQVLKDYYEAIHNLLEAISSSIGKKVRGGGAHAELISMVSRKFELDTSTEKFLQSLRRYRNRISYEGFFIKEDYLERNENRIRETINELERILEYSLDS